MGKKTQNKTTFRHVKESSWDGGEKGAHLLIKTPRVVGGTITLRHSLLHIPANKLTSTPTWWRTNTNYAWMFP